MATVVEVDLASGRVRNHQKPVWSFKVTRCPRRCETFSPRAASSLCSGSQTSVQLTVSLPPGRVVLQSKCQDAIYEQCHRDRARCRGIAGTDLLDILGRTSDAMVAIDA